MREYIILTVSRVCKPYFRVTNIDSECYVFDNHHLESKLTQTATKWRFNWNYGTAYSMTT